MGEEAFDEVEITCEDGMRLYVRGGYGREEVWLGIGRPTEDDIAKGYPGEPALIVELDSDARRALTRAIREMVAKPGRARKTRKTQDEIERDTEGRG
jgi:hypothetical protein